MNIKNTFELLVAVSFVMSPQLVGLGPKAQDFMMFFALEKDNTSQNSTFEIFKHGKKLSAK